MTCIAGVVHDGKVYIGGDSAGVAGWSLTVRADEKVFKNGGFLFGFTSSFRMGQILRYSFSPPAKPEGKDIYAYMVTDFIDAVRGALKSGGYATKENEAESGGTFLVGHAGRLFEINSDYQVGESADPWAAVGCGHALAAGALYATPSLPPRKRLETALGAAERHSAGVRGPFHILSI